MSCSVMHEHFLPSELFLRAESKKWYIANCCQSLQDSPCLIYHSHTLFFHSQLAFLTVLESTIITAVRK
jgi:hypothetical protein